MKVWQKFVKLCKKDCCCSESGPILMAANGRFVKEACLRGCYAVDSNDLRTKIVRRQATVSTTPTGRGPNRSFCQRREYWSKIRPVMLTPRLSLMFGQWHEPFCQQPSGALSRGPIKKKCFAVLLMNGRHDAMRWRESPR